MILGNICSRRLKQTTLFGNTELLANRSSVLRKNVVRLTDRLDMAVAVDWDVKPHAKQTYGLKSCLFRKRQKADVALQ